MSKKEKAASCEAASSRLKQPTDQSNLYVRCTALAILYFNWQIRIEPSEEMIRSACKIFSINTSTIL
jgi:hypothetical protein